MHPQDSCFNFEYLSALFYLHPILKWLFGILNKFKRKRCQLKVLWLFQDVQHWFWSFLDRRSFEELNFKCEKFKHNFSWINDFKKKKLSTITFYNFLRSTTLVLVISPSKIVWIIWISSVRKFKRIFSWIDYFKWKSC